MVKRCRSVISNLYIANGVECWALLAKVFGFIAKNIYVYTYL